MTLTAPRQGVQIPGPGPDADRIRLDYRLIRIALLMVGCYAFFDCSIRDLRRLLAATGTGSDLDPRVAVAYRI